MAIPALSTASRLLADLVGQDCTLCGSESPGGVICGECECRLPVLREGCEICAIALPAPGVCASCIGEPPAFDRALAVFEYAFPADCLVHRFKFSGDHAVGAWLGARLGEKARSVPRPDLLVSPPLSASRLRERGFNQAHELAKRVGKSLGISVLQGAVRLRESASQLGLGRRERRQNLEGAFRASTDVAGHHMALVDDVMTTGATAEAMARALRVAGAAQVSVWVVARTAAPGDRT